LEILVEIENGRVRVNGDEWSLYTIHKELLERYINQKIAPKQLLALGESIYGAIFSNEKREQLLNSKDDIFIKIYSKTPKIHNIPFELIAKDGKFLLKEPNIYLFRDIYISDLDTIKPSTSKIKILFILSQPLELLEHSAIDPLRELNKVKNSLKPWIDRGIVELHIEEKPSIKRLKERFKNKDYDIIHYSGHGNREGELILEDNDNPTRPYFANATELKEIFENANAKLIYLDSCEGAASSGISPSLAVKLREALKCAVVANTSSISDRAATLSVEKFYENIDKPLINAISIVRRDIKEEWYKSVYFGDTTIKLFEADKKESKNDTEKFIYGVNSQFLSDYIYRYRLIRKASDIIQDSNSMQIIGLGGSGKSSLANYICNFFESYFDAIVFIDFKLEEIKEPNDLFELLSDVLSTKVDSVESLIDRLNMLNKPLLVFDNFEFAQNKDGTLTPKWRRFYDKLFRSSIFTIFTSRIELFRTPREPLFEDSNTLKIGEYEESDLLLLLHHTRDVNKQQKLATLLPIIKEKFSYHPLSIAIALKSDLSTNNIDKVLEDSELQELMSYYKDYLNNSALRAWLYLPVPLKKDDTIEFLGLENYKLINKLGLALHENGYIKPYRIVRYFIEFKNEDREFLIEKLEKINSYEANLNLLALGDESKHLEYLVKVLGSKSDINLINRFLKKELIEKQLKSIEDRETKSFIQNNLGNLYSDLGEYEKAKEYYIKALETKEELLKSNPAYLGDLAGTQNNLGNLYSKLGEYEKAERLYIKALENYEKLSKLNPAYLGNLAMTQNNLGNLYSNLGEYEKAKEYYLKALENYEKLSKLNPAYLGNLAMTQNNLGLLYWNLGEYEKAERLYIKALENYEKLSKLNPAYLGNLAMTQNNLGLLYWNLGEYEKAERLYIKALENYEKLSKLNPAYLGDLAMTQNNLGNLYSKLGEYEKAERLYIKALKIREELSKLNPAYLGDLAGIQHNLGLLYWNLGEYEKAERLYIKALKIREELSKLNPAYLGDLAMTQNNLGNLYSKLGEYEKAERLYIKALKIREELSKLNPAYLGDLAMTQNNLGNLYSNLGEYEKAERLYIKALKIREELSKLNPAYLGDLAMTQNNLGLLYWNLGEYEKAKEYYKDAVENYEKVIKFNIGELIRYIGTYLRFLKVLFDLKEWEEIAKRLPRLFELEVLADSKGLFEAWFLKEGLEINDKDVQEILNNIKYENVKNRAKRAFDYVLAEKREL